MPRGSWRPLREDPEGAAALLTGPEAEARAAGHAGEAEELSSLRKKIFERKAEGGVLQGARGHLEGLAIWETVGTKGRRVGPIQLEKKCQNPSDWKRFLTALLDSTDPAGPVLLFNSSLPGFPEADAAEFLAPRGFLPYHRYGLAFPAQAPLPPDAVKPLQSGRVRNVSPADLEGLAELSAASYANSIDLFLFAREDDEMQEARRLLRTVFEGQYGTFLTHASFGLEIDGVIRGATLVTDRTQYKLIADVEVHPRFQGHGHARRLIRATLQAVSPDATAPLVLAVTRENVAAYELYRHLGFVVQDGPFTFWANPAALGISPPAPTAEARVTASR
ncbi:MAG: GNAT family N-acetyltransferase [Thermoplasmata archaeon]